MDNEIRLIDANALKEFINNGRVCDICPNKKLNCAIHCDFPDTLTPLLEKVIDNAPTVERPQGEWRVVKNNELISLYCICTNCREMGCNKFNFCPNCGAMMKEAENECKNDT